MYDNLINKLRVGAKCFPGWKLYGYAKEPYSLMPEDLEQAADAIEGLELCCKNFEEALKELDEKLDKVEQKKGEWIPVTEQLPELFACSQCKRIVPMPTFMGKPFWEHCPRCGAKMAVNDE